ncbi:hypothetical protein RUM4293_03828 [Ruegeria atlantica]|uniref:Uncharacterized protein n=1 Tax=Ruegeria atlantica TaxID=81569 RepID=A0A0P1E7P1_9RHOB|nr:hypothetical protein RUM4293_03828 [Ruegeria atlantica]
MSGVARRHLFVKRVIKWDLVLSWTMKTRPFASVGQYARSAFVHGICTNFCTERTPEVLCCKGLQTQQKPIRARGGQGRLSILNSNRLIAHFLPNAE